MTARKSLVALAFVSLVALGLGLASPGQKPAADKEAGKAIAPGTYEIDGTHSSFLFRAKHLGVAWFYGAFEKASGRFTFDPKPESCSVEVEIETGSVDSRNAKRDAHLKSGDFLDAVQFPTASFKSKSVKKSGDRKYAVTGDLSLHGVTKSVSCDVEETGFADTRKGVLAGFHAVLTIKRSDFGIKYMLEDNGISDEVQLTFSVEGNQTETARK